VLLYTCGQKKRGAWLGHPCGKAARALDQAGYEYEVKVVGGYRFLPWDKPRRDEDRVEVRRLSGANEVPILVFEDGEVIAGSAIIARWAGEHPAASAARSEV
jgi:glutathione S-transferase